MVAAVAVLYWGLPAYDRHHAAVAEANRRAEAERAAIAARADQQHAWVTVGDDRGVYGTVGTELMRNMSTV